MKGRRPLAALAITLLVACTHDFDAFTPSGAGELLRGEDASVPSTPAQDAAVPVADAASDSGGPTDASSDAQACTSAPAGCLAQRTTCRNGCSATYTSCDALCPNGNGGDPCRQTCMTNRNQCFAGCDNACRSCSGSCTIGCG